MLRFAGVPAFLHLISIEFMDFNEQNHCGHSKANGSQDVLISGVVPRARQADYPSDKEERA